MIRYISRLIKTPITFILKRVPVSRIGAFRVQKRVFESVGVRANGLYYNNFELRGGLYSYTGLNKRGMLLR